MSESNFTIQDCDAVVKKYFKTDEAESVNFSVVRLRNQNYSIKITVNHGGKEKVLNFFAKSGLGTPKINQIFRDFKKVLPTFGSTITPKLYYEKSHLFLFEDLAWQGFQVCDSTSRYFDLNHVKIVLNVLAKLHAASFAFEDIKSEETQKIYRLNHEYNLDYYNIQLTKSSVIALITSLLDDSSEDNLKKTIERLEGNLSSQKCRRTLCHSNLTIENIMFKYVEGVPVECKLINFRSTQYAPPIYDVLQVIFFNTNEDFRQQCFHSLLNHYYLCLEEELQKYNLRIVDILSDEEWQTQTHQFLPLTKLECVLRHQDSLEELKEDLNCPLLSRQDCYAIVENKLKTANFHFKSFEVTPVGSVSGFLGDYYKLLIKVCYENEDSTINCFIKRMPKSTVSREMVDDSNSFFKETFAYRTLVPKFREFGIDIIDDCLPECYFQRPGDIIVFEDVAVQNYRIQAPQKPYDFDSLCMVVKKLAKFHASSFVYEERMSEKLGRPYRLIEDYEEYFKEGLFVEDENHSGGKLMITGMRGVLDAVNLFPEIKTEESEEHFKKFWPEFTKLSYSRPADIGRFRNVWAHGDLWSSNILMRFEDDKPTDCRFVDLQLFRYCPPGHDLLFVLHLTTLRETRIKYEEDLKKIYYEELTNLLKSYEYSIADILPYENFIDGFNYMRAQVVMAAAAIYGMFSMCTPEQISSMLTNEEEGSRIFYGDRKEFLTKMCSISPIYKSTLRDRIQDVYDYCNSMSK